MKRKRLKKRNMKSICLVLGIVFGIGIVLAGSFLFVFGDRVFEETGGDFASTRAVVAVNILNSEENIDDKGNNEGLSGDLVNGFGGGSGGGGSNNGASTEGGESGCSKSQQVQYSLGEFYENIECLVYGVSGCESVSAVCGSEIFNLDYDVGGVFDIRHSVFLGEDEVAFEVISENVGPRGKKTLRFEVVLSGAYDVSSLKCVVNSETVPAKCLY